MPRPSSSHASLSLVVGRDHGKTSDSELARGLVAGEPWALGEAWHRFAPMVLAMAERCLGSKSEAQDVCQDVFFRLFHKAACLRDPDSLRSYVYSFAIRALRTELRRRKLRAWLSFDAPQDAIDRCYRSVDVESRDLLRRFHTLLDRLSPRDRLVFILRRMESMTVEEIANHMDISESTVKRCILHATERLSRWIVTDPELASHFNLEPWGR